MGQRLVVVGGDPGGMGAATQARRLDPSLDVVALEKGRWTSYSACGIPYVVGGDVGGIDELVARTPQELRDGYGIDVRTRHEAMAIDLDSRKVEVRDHEHGRTFSLGFDLLHLGTGARPVRPPLPGIDHEAVRGVQTLEDASVLLERAQRGRCDHVVVVGGGYIGLEMAEAFLKRGARVTVVDSGPQVMRTLDPDMAALVQAALERHGVEVMTGAEVGGFSPAEGGGVVVETSAGDLPADLVILGLGVVPNSELGAAAGAETGHRGALRVDRRQRTTLEGVSAAGDCCESWHLVARRHLHVALGTVANRQARVAGINLGGGYATFPGVVGTAVSKLCATEVGRTGLITSELGAAGLEAEATTVESGTRAGYYPGAGPITVKVLAERGTGRLLGAQLVGYEGAAKRVDVFATALHAGMTVDQIVDLDLSYAPPFSPVWDPVAVAARQAVSPARQAAPPTGEGRG